MKRRICVLIGWIGLSAAILPASGTLSFEERVEAQEAIERVYYNHRIWPKENPGPKPPFETVVTEAAVRIKVEDYLLKAAALEHYWNVVLTGKQLQAELDRIGRQTKAPDMLREVFAALNNDPATIAECYARPLLTDRILRNAYNFDDRIHGQLKAQVVALGAALKSGAVGELAMGESFAFHLEVGEAGPPLPGGPSSLDRESFARACRDLPPAAGEWKLVEREDAFIYYFLDARTATAVKGKGVAFPKELLETWLAGPAGRTIVPSMRPVAPESSYSLPGLRHEAATTPESWDYIWYQPEPRAYHTAVWTGSALLVWGGQLGTLYLNTGGRYDPLTDAWEPITVLKAPKGRAYHTAVWTGREMIVWGGAGDGGELFNDGKRYDPVDDTWSDVETTLAPEPRYGHTAVWTGQKMIVWGGSNSPDYFLVGLNTGGMYTPPATSGSSGTWAATSTWITCPSPRWGHTAVWTGQRMVIWGGVHYDGSALIYRGDGAQFDPDAFPTTAWQSLGTANAPSARMGHAAVWDGEQMVVWGGYGGTYLNNGGRYSLSNLTWNAVPIPSPPAPGNEGRTGHTAVWTGDRMVVFGGNNGAAGDFKYAQAYNPVNNLWDPSSTGTEVTSRWGHTAVWTGEGLGEMILWGGWDFSTGAVSNAGMRYQYSGDLWTVFKPKSTTPLVRQAHSAVWTGSEYIIWGGSSDINTEPVSGLNSGHLYHPDSGNWSAVTALFAPAARHGHTAVWSGAQMIIWGGQSQSDFLSDGKRYNPVGLGSWTAMADPPVALAGRCHHTANWTGTEMVVWGGHWGSEEPTCQNDGAHYDPSSNTWPYYIPSSSVIARTDHTTVWTGNQMIVWGGLNYSESVYSYLNSGAIYDPSTYGWSSTASAGSLAGRRGHSAVWTGGEMIIWGGMSKAQDGTSTWYNDGGVYTPAYDSWSPTDQSSPVLPSARAGHSAVWTGTEMLIWGGTGDPGSTDGSYKASGGRYDHYALYQWKTVPETSILPGRAYSPAVWTGQSLLFWDGYPMSQTGGLFYPDSPPSARVTALYDHQLDVPLCPLTAGGSPFDTCNSGTTLDGCGTSEAHTPNTLGPAATKPKDGTAGTYHVDESIDRILVTGANGGIISAGFKVDLSVEVWAGAEFANDVLEIFYSSNPYDAAPDWASIPTSGWYPMQSGTNTFTTTVLLGGGTRHAFRAHFFRNGQAGYDDYDDLVLLTSGETFPPVPVREFGATDDLVLDGSISTTGSNYSTDPPWTDALDSIAADDYLWWVNYHPGVLDTCDAMLTPPNRTGATLSLGQGDLAGLGMSTPGRYRVMLRVKDELGTFDCTDFDLELIDTQAPSVELIMPDGGETWPYSPSGSDRKQDLVAWGFFDEFGPRRTRLSYTTNCADATCSTAAWTCIADSGMRSSSPDIPKPIADRTSTTSTLEYFDASTIYDVNITLTLRHPYVGDLVLLLRHLNTMTQVTLSQKRGSSGADFIGTTFDDEAPEAIGSGTTPFMGSFRPETALSAFNGESTVGTWELIVTDDILSNLTGFIESWSVTFVTSASGDCSGGTNDANSNVSGTDILTPDSTNFLWDLPTKTEAAGDGQTFPSAQCRVKVEIWDTSDNLASDQSTGNFYIVAPTTTSIETLILWNSLRFRALYGDSHTTSLQVRLNALAQNLKVNGKVLDLNDSATVRDAYTAWDLDPLSVTAANAVAQAIWTYLYAPSSGKISTTYPNTRAIILVGDDRQIPFHRMADGTMVGRYAESQYLSEVALNPRTGVGAALAADYFLTDNFYAESAPETSGLDSPHDLIYQNDYAIGRLVETPSQMEGIINTFLAQDGEVDLHSRTSLVTGFDFVYDGAVAVKDSMETSIGVGAADCLMDDPLRGNTTYDVNQCILPETDPLSEHPYTPGELGTLLLKGTSDPNDLPASPLNAILTHANHYSLAASQTDGSSQNYCTRNTPGTEYQAGCSAGFAMESEPNDVKSSVVYTSGCHSGLSVPPAGIPDDLPLTIPYGETSSTITISGSGLIISDVNVRVTIQHPSVGDLTLVLDTPFGALSLSNLRGGSGDHFILTTFDDQASTPIASGTAPFTGAYRPETPLSMLPAVSPDGVWGLRVGDTVSGGRGAIVDWALTINNSVSYPSSPFALDLAESMAAKKAVAYVGNTGYGWAIQNGKGLTETLVVNLTEELGQAGSISVGRALANAKRNYFLEDKRYDVFDEKVLHQMTLFGIPNYSIINSSGARASSEVGKLPPPDGPDHACAEGVCLDKEVRTSALNADLPPGMTEILQNIRFSDFGVYNLVEVCTELDGLAGCGATDLPYFGEYYTLNGYASGETGDAIQPKFIYETYLSGTHHHGILFTGGTLHTPEAGFKVLGAVPRSTPTDPNPDAGPLPSVGSFVPGLKNSTSPSGTVSVRGSEEKEYVNMVVHTGYCTNYLPKVGETPATCTEHRYRDMQYATYYHLSSGDYTAPALQAEEQTTVAPAAACSSFDCSIADGGSTSAYISVTESLTVTDINVTVNLTHGYPADLRLTLMGPDATMVVLSDRNGGSADDYGGLTSPVRSTVFDDDATVPIASGVGPFRGSYRPDNSVNGAFEGKSTLGTWTLQVDDLDNNGEAGTINAWSLTFNERYHSITGLNSAFRVKASDASGLYRVLVTYKDEGLQSPAWKSLDLTENTVGGYWEGQLPVWGSTAYFIQAVDQAGNVGQVVEAGQDQGSGSEAVKYGSTWEYAKSFSIPITDTDSDGLPDVYEDQHTCLAKGTPDAGGDPDLDLMTNLEEYYAGTDPCLADTDRGGDNDGSEKHNGRNPLAAGDDKPLTVKVVKGGGNLATLEWPDGVQSSPQCPLKPNERFNNVIDGRYFVYRSLNDPFFETGDLLTTGGLDEATRCLDDSVAAAPGQAYFYKMFNYLLIPPTVNVVWNPDDPSDPDDPSGINVGSRLGGEVVTVYGSKFRTGARVFFGGVLATAVSVSSGGDSITCTTPAHAAGPVSVLVVNSDLAQGVLGGSFSYIDP